MRRLILAALLVSPAAAQEEDPIELSLSGIVADERGEPLAGVRIEAWDALQAERYLGEATSGSKGRFLLALRRSDLARREHRFGPLRLAAKGQELATAVLDVEAGAREVSIVARPAREIRGTVVEAGGGPVPGAIVTGRATGVPPEDTTADEEGRFRLLRFGAGAEVRIEAYRDHVGLVARAAAGEGDVALTLPRAAYVRGSVAEVGSGEPVAGARLLWRGHVVAEADARGRFEVAVDPSAPPLVVAVVAPGHLVETVTVAGPGPVEVRMAKAEALRGRVVDADGRAVAGALVTLEGEPGLRLVARPDDDGLFAFDVVPRGLVRIAAGARGYLDATVRLEATAAGEDLTLEMRRGTPMAGRTLRGGAPAVGVRVSVVDAHGEEIAFGYSDAHGRFLLDAVPEGTAHLHAAAADGASLGVPVDAAAPRGPYLLEVKEHLPLRGTLRSDAGFALAGVRVECPGAGRAATTDAEGRFAFDRLPARPLRLEAAPDRHFPLRVEARPGAPLDLVATSRFGEGRIEVTVTNAAAFDVELAARGDPPVRRTASRAGEGTPVVFDGLAPGRYGLRVRAAGFLEAEREVELTAEVEATRVALVLERGGTLKLVASPGASVAIFALKGKAPPVVALKLAEGTQTLFDFGPGLYRLVSRAPGELVVVREVELGPTTPPQELDLRGGEEFTLVVDVRDAEGNPVPGVAITLVSETGFERKVQGRTDEAGRLRVERPFDGPMHVRAAKADRLAEAAVTPPARSVALTLR